MDEIVALDRAGAAILSAASDVFLAIASLCGVRDRCRHGYGVTPLTDDAIADTPGLGVLAALPNTVDTLRARQDYALGSLAGMVREHARGMEKIALSARDVVISAHDGMALLGCNELDDAQWMCAVTASAELSYQRWARAHVWLGAAARRVGHATSYTDARGMLSEVMKC